MVSTVVCCQGIPALEQFLAEFTRQSSHVATEVGLGVALGSSLVPKLVLPALLARPLGGARVALGHHALQHPIQIYTT